MELVGSEEKELVDFVLEKIRNQTNAESIMEDLKPVKRVVALKFICVVDGRRSRSICHEVMANGHL